MTPAPAWRPPVQARSTSPSSSAGACTDDTLALGKARCNHGAVVGPDVIGRAWITSPSAITDGGNADPIADNGGGAERDTGG
jgi:hypothetical protein